MTEEQIAALRATHGTVRAIHMHGHTLVFRAPSRAEAQQHMGHKESPDPMIRALADERLLQLMLVSFDGQDIAPSKEAFLTFLTKKPYFCGAPAVVHALAVLCGLVEDAEGKD